MENVCFFGDPDLRVFVPGTDYSDNNYWETEDVKSLRYDKACSIDGHMPFGVASYPHEIQQLTFWQEYLVRIVALIVVVLLLVILVGMGWKKKK